MIVYLASYPRSGNSWVRRLLRNQFRYLDTPIHGDPAPQREAFLSSEWNLEGHFRLVDYPPVDPQRPFGRYVCNDGERTPRLLLMPGCQGRLADAGFRRELAAMPETVFIKTHLPPFSEHFAGERVVQPIRHPGASLWSYYHFLRDVRGRAVTLEAVIAGEEGFGCWSAYHAAWETAAQGPEPNLLRVRYEDLFGNELGFCRRLAEFTGLPLLSSDLKPFAYYQRRLPSVARSGRVDEWRQGFSPEQTALLAQRHGRQMMRLDYSLPELS